METQEARRIAREHMETSKPAAVAKPDTPLTMSLVRRLHFMALTVLTGWLLYLCWSFISPYGNGVKEYDWDFFWLLIVFCVGLYLLPLFALLLATSLGTRPWKSDTTIVTLCILLAISLFFLYELGDHGLNLPPASDCNYLCHNIDTGNTALRLPTLYPLGGVALSVGLLSLVAYVESLSGKYDEAKRRRKARAAQLASLREARDSGIRELSALGQRDEADSIRKKYSNSFLEQLDEKGIEMFLAVLRVAHEQHVMQQQAEGAGS